MAVTGDRPDYTGTFGTSHLDVAGTGEGTTSSFLLTISVGGLFRARQEKRARPFRTFVTRQLTCCLPATCPFAIIVL